MNKTRLDSLERSVRECDGACNDGDYICLCRPMDVQEALTAIKSLEWDASQLRETFSHTFVSPESNEGTACRECGLDLRNQIHRRA